MAEKSGEQLAKYAEEQMEDALRTVFVLHDDDCEVIYLRDDIRQRYTADQYKRVAESFRIDLNTAVRERTESQIGSKNSIIHYHEGAYVFQFPHSDCHSILLSIEPRVGSQLKSFIKDCQNQISDGK